MGAYRFERFVNIYNHRLILYIGEMSVCQMKMEWNFVVYKMILNVGSHSPHWHLRIPFKLQITSIRHTYRRDLERVSIIIMFCILHKHAVQWIELQTFAFDQCNLLFYVFATVNLVRSLIGEWTFQTKQNSHICFKCNFVRVFNICLAWIRAWHSLFGHISSLSFWKLAWCSMKFCPLTVHFNILHCDTRQNKRQSPKCWSWLCVCLLFTVHMLTEALSLNASIFCIWLQ